MAHTFDELENHEHHFAVRPNKSAIKRENAALEELGEELITLPKERLNALNLPAQLHEAVRLAQTIESHHGAFKRQRKFIAKLLREMDATPIRNQLDNLGRENALAINQLHIVERWRDRLLNGDDHDLNAWMAEHPHSERQKLRQLVRDAHKEHQTASPPRSARLLFKYLRELVSDETEEGFGGEDIED